ncbi:hypothetical protein Tco_0670548 [Tanacetum coccineum]
MTTLKFVDTHNMVAFLAKPAESEGFEQIVDFLNAHTIKYALTINPTIYTSCIEQFWATVKAKTINGEVQLQALVDGKKIIITEYVISHISGNIAKTQSKATPNESSSLGTTSNGGPKRQETMRDTITHTRFKNVSKHSNDPLLARGRVKSSRDEESLGKDASKQGRINAIDADEDITLVNDQDDADMFDVNTLTGDEVLAEQEVATKDVNLTVDEVTLAQALAALKSVKPKVKVNVVEEPSVPVSAGIIKVSVATTTTTAIIPTPRKRIIITELGTSTTTKTISSQPSQAKVQDKGKGIMVEEPMKMKKKDQISLLNKKLILQAEFDEEERLAREKDEANVALTEQWDDIQAKIKELMEIVPDEEEVAINAIPLATKPPTIVDWKNHKEGKKNYY